MECAFCGGNHLSMECPNIQDTPAKEEEKKEEEKKEDPPKK